MLGIDLVLALLAVIDYLTEKRNGEAHTAFDFCFTAYVTEYVIAYVVVTFVTFCYW